MRKLRLSITSGKHAEMSNAVDEKQACPFAFPTTKEYNKDMEGITKEKRSNMKCLSELKAQIEEERACLHQQLLEADNITQCCVQSHKLDQLLEEYYRVMEENASFSDCCIRTTGT